MNAWGHILGLDISTSIIGYTVLEFDGEILEIGSWDLRNKKLYPDLFSKAINIKEELIKLNKRFLINNIFIETSLNMFMSGKSSANILSMLAKFNGIVSWIAYECFETSPRFIAAASARKKCGITIKRGTKAKEQVMAFLLDNEPDFKIQYTRTGKPKPHCYDEADSLIIAKAGYECLKEKLE